MKESIVKTALILAGGRGSRLKDMTKNTPKSMIKMAGIPLIEHQIILLKRYGVKEILILSYYLSEVIEEYFKDGSNFGVKISHFKEEHPLGTAGCIKELEGKLKKDFLVIYGDLVLSINLKKFIGFHKEMGGICSLVLHPNDHMYDSDLVEIDKDGKIIDFHSKPHDENKYYRNLVNAGVYILSPKVLKYITKGIMSDLGKDIFPKIFKKEKMYGYTTAEYVKDMGTPERFEKTNQDLIGGKVERLNNENKRKAIFIDRDGTMIKEVPDIHKVEDIELFPETTQAIKKINKSEFLAIAATNQPAVAKGFCSIKDIEEMHKKLETLLGREGAFLDGIFFCPHHPERGHHGENPLYKISCKCRKPYIGMIKEAQSKFNIDLENSFFICNSFRDVECGKKAGCRTIFVLKGEIIDKFKDLKADYYVEDILEAVNLIIDGVKDDNFTNST